MYYTIKKVFKMHKFYISLSGFKHVAKEQINQLNYKLRDFKEVTFSDVFNPGAYIINIDKKTYAACNKLPRRSNYRKLNFEEGIVEIDKYLNSKEIQSIQLISVNNKVKRMYVKLSTIPEVAAVENRILKNHLYKYSYTDMSVTAFSQLYFRIYPEKKCFCTQDTLRQNTRHTLTSIEDAIDFLVKFEGNRKELTIDLLYSLLPKLKEYIGAGKSGYSTVYCKPLNSNTNSFPVKLIKQGDMKISYTGGKPALYIESVTRENIHTMSLVWLNGEWAEIKQF